MHVLLIALPFVLPGCISPARSLRRPPSATGSATNSQPSPRLTAVEQASQWSQLYADARRRLVEKDEELRRLRGEHGQARSDTEDVLERDRLEKGLKLTAVEQAIRWSQLYADTLQKLAEKDKELKRLRGANRPAGSDTEDVAEHGRLEKELGALKSMPAPDALPLGKIAQRWAVAIGISEYEHTSSAFPNLKYAHRDAERFAKFLKSPRGGSFQGDHVKLLTNEAATKEAITSALFDFLKHTVREDFVVIYFSGHGLPDPDKPSNTYLMAHDSDPVKIASTGFPMWDLETALTRTISAERVVVLADACHSAAATKGVKGVRVARRFNSYFDELAKSGPGRVMFTSCRDDEVSREDEKWGGGHGVFTWALLKGLEGEADADKDGVVRLGEVLDYADITVRRESANEQNPVKSGTRFDPALPMGLVR